MYSCFGKNRIMLSHHHFLSAGDIQAWLSVAAARAVFACMPWVSMRVCRVTLSVVCAMAAAASIRQRMNGRILFIALSC